jgi:hypothetical protein
MRKPTLLLLLTLLPTAVPAQTVHPPRAILAIEKPQIDNGDVRRGDIVHYVFKLKNTGDAPLEIFARPNCGCTVANFDKVIPPGAEGKIEADLNTASFRGRILKTIDVSSNDLDRPRTNLHLLANVVSLVQILPTETPLLALKGEGPTVKELELRPTGKEPIEIIRADCSVPYASVQLEPIENAGGTGKAYKLRLTVQPEAPLGRSVLLVTAFTSSVREPRIYFTAICDKGILAIPQSVFMGALTSKTVQPVTQILTLTRSDGDFHVLKVESEDANLKVQPEALAGSHQYRLTVTYQGGWPVGAVRSKITVLTDDPRQPRIEIPVLANVTSDAGTGK